MKKHFLLLLAGLFFLLGTGFISLQNDKNKVVGLWLSENKDGKIQIYEQNGKFYGKIVGGDRPEALDAQNPDPKLRSRKLIGLVIMTDFVYDGEGTWEDGKIYDPDSGKTYSCLMRLKNNNELEIRGYVGVSWLGRTSVWSKIN